MWRVCYRGGTAVKAAGPRLVAVHVVAFRRRINNHSTLCGEAAWMDERLAGGGKLKKKRNLEKGKSCAR